jgi:carbonic anhydrase
MSARLIYFDFKYFKNEMKSVFDKKYLKDDVYAGISVACVAIPLSLALAMASNVDPGVGLISAIIGGIIAAIFGGTRLAITGPANTMAILIAQVVQNYGLSGLVIVGIICGVLQFLSGLFGLARYAKLVPLTVISAFTAGIGFILFVSQLPKALQLSAPQNNQAIYIIKHIGMFIEHMNPMAFMLALLTVLILKILPKYFPKLPTPLIAVMIPTIIVSVFGLTGINLVGSIPHSLPLPQVPNFASNLDWMSLFESSLEVFLLASLETLLSSSSLDVIGRGDLHNPNQELIGQGLANFVTAIFGGIPVTAVVARSSVNLAAGAKTRRSAIFHAIVILLIIYLCPKIVEIIPVSALAGILLGASMTMMNPKDVIDFWKSDRKELVVYIITFLLIVTSDLISGITVGVFVAFLVVAFRMLTTKVDFRLWANKEVLRIGLSGNMTFWSFEKITSIENYIIEQNNLKFVILEFDSLKGMDPTGALHLVKLIKSVSASGVKVILHNLDDNQLAMIEKVSGENKPYNVTVTEDEIKYILEDSSIKHSAVDVLKGGMGKFVGEFAIVRKNLMRNLSQQQKPHTLFITCSDSRVNPNVFLSAGLGELFIVKNVGNVVPPYVEGNHTYSEGAAIDFAINYLGVKNIVICGHTECGAIKSSLSDDKLNYDSLNNWLDIIKDGYKKNSMPIDSYQGVKFNLLNQVENLKTYRSVKDMLDSGEIHLSAWVYDVKTAHILEWNNQLGKFECIQDKERGNK